MNALLEEYLRHFIIASQKNWVDLLHATQFCYNLHRSSSTGVSPFELAIGLQPRVPQEVAKQKVGQVNLQHTAWLGIGKRSLRKPKRAWRKPPGE